MGLCFGFVLKTVLVTQGCFRWSWAGFTQSQGLFCSSLRPTSEQAGGHKELAGDTAGTAEPNWPKGYAMPYDTMLSIQSWGNKKERGDVWSYVVFPSNHYTWWSPAFLKMAEHQLADQKWWKNSLFCFACVHSFCFTCSTAFILTHEFSCFYPSDSLSHRTWGGVNEWLCGAELPAGVKPQHPSNKQAILCTDSMQQERVMKCLLALHFRWSLSTIM